MATLTNADYAAIRKAIYIAGAGKEELKARANLPSKAQQMAVFQAIEDDAVARFSTQKALIDANIGGAATTNVLAQKYLAGYYKWKINKLLGL